LLENNNKKEISLFVLFCKLIDSIDTSLEVFSKMNHFLKDNKIKWGNFIRLCTNKDKSVSWQNAGHTVCFIDRHFHLEIMNEELQIVFEAVIRVVNYVKNSSLRGRLIVLLGDNMEAEHSAPKLLWSMLTLLCQSSSQGIRIKRRNSHFC